MNTLEIIAAFVAVVGGFKALDWVIEKFNAKHDKEQQIDSTEEAFKAYKLETDAKIASLQSQLSNAHVYAQSSMDAMKKEIVQTLTDHREEYMQGINDVKASITEMSAIYQQTVAVVELKIQTLSDRVEKHNSVVERTYKIETDIEVLKNREKVSENRLADVEEVLKKNEK